MKTAMMLATLTIGVLAIGAFTAPVLAQEQGQTTGTETQGAPLNSSVTDSARDPATGYTPGYRARGQAQSCRRVTIRDVTPSGRVIYRTVRRCH